VVVVSTLFRLLGYVRPYRGRAIVTTLLAAFTAFCAVGTIGILKPFLDTLFDEQAVIDMIAKLRASGGISAWLPGDLSAWAADVIEPILIGDKIRAISYIIALLIALRVIGGVARFFQEFLGGLLSQRIMVDVSCDMHRRTMRQSPGFLGGFGLSDAISRFTADIQALGAGIRSIFYVLIPEPLKFVLSLGVAFALSWKLTILVILLFPVSFFLIRRMGRTVKKAGRQVLEKRAVILGQLQDTLFGLPVVQVYGREADTSERFRQTTERVYTYWRRVLRTQAATGPAVEMVGVVGGSVAMFAAGHMVLDDQMGTGSFSLFCVAILTLYEPIRKLASTVNRLQLAAAAADRITELMDHIPEIQDVEGAPALGPVSDAIELQDVSFAYPGRHLALDGLSLRIPAGSTVAVVGPSGAGKSTFATLIPRLVDPDKGRVLIDGRDIRGITLRSLRDQIALVPQETILFSESIAENIAFAKPEATRGEVLAAAEAAHVAEFAEALPDGYDTWLGDGGHGLSGGERQRVALARAMLRDPRILILDEATSALDPKSEALIRDSLDRFLEGRTAIVIAHHPRALRRVDLVIVLDDGRLDCAGTPAECMDRSDVYRSFAALGGGVPDMEKGGAPS
jgi:ATP-binding cassette, subfamily B, bacterial MsbA